MRERWEHQLGWFGIASLCAACLIGSLTYTQSFLWFWEKKISFLPDLLSGLIAAAALVPLYRKGLLAAPFRGAMVFIPLALVFYLSAVLANIGLGHNGWTLLKLPIAAITGMILLLANLNIMKYAELALLVLVFLATVNVVAASHAMGFWGFAFLATSLTGILLVFDEKRVLRNILGREQSIDD